MKLEFRPEDGGQCEVRGQGQAGGRGERETPCQSQSN